MKSIRRILRVYIVGCYQMHLSNRKYSVFFSFESHLYKSKNFIIEKMKKTKRRLSDQTYSLQQEKAQMNDKCQRAPYSNTYLIGFRTTVENNLQTIPGPLDTIADVNWTDDVVTFLAASFTSLTAEINSSSSFSGITVVSGS